MTPESKSYYNRMFSLLFKGLGLMLCGVWLGERHIFQVFVILCVVTVLVDIAAWVRRRS